MLLSCILHSALKWLLPILFFFSLLFFFPLYVYNTALVWGGIFCCWLVFLVCSSFLVAASLVIGLGACRIHEVPLVSFLPRSASLCSPVNFSKLSLRLPTFSPDFVCFGAFHVATRLLPTWLSQWHIWMRMHRIERNDIVLSCGGFIRPFPQRKRLFAVMA